LEVGTADKLLKSRTIKGAFKRGHGSSKFCFISEGHYQCHAKVNASL